MVDTTIECHGPASHASNGLEALDRRVDQRFIDLKSANEQRFGDIGKANEVALSAQKEALKTASETTDKALLTASQAVEKALVIERTSTKEKFDTLNESSKRQESQLNNMIPRGEVTVKIDAVSDRVKKTEEFIATQIAGANIKKDYIGWIVAGIMSLLAIILPFLQHLIK
jgi:hypothetical protein